MFQIITNYFFYKKINTTIEQIEKIIEKDNQKFLNLLNSYDSLNFPIFIKKNENCFELSFYFKEEKIDYFENLSLNFDKKKNKSGTILLEYFGSLKEVKKTFTNEYQKQINESGFLRNIQEKIKEKSSYSLNHQEKNESDFSSKEILVSIEIPKNYDSLQIKVENAFVNMNWLFQKKMISHQR